VIAWLGSIYRSGRFRMGLRLSVGGTATPSRSIIAGAAAGANIETLSKELVDLHPEVGRTSPKDKSSSEREIADGVFRLLSGSVDILRELNGDPILLGTIGAGQFIGEMGGVENRPRSAAARAAGRVFEPHAHVAANRGNTTFTVQGGSETLVAKAPTDTLVGTANVLATEVKAW
jgi:hypothetical protein